MNVLGLIPARGGSKGIPRKNIAPLGGRPLIVWTIDAALRAQGLSRVVVSTDDDEIAIVAAGAGAEVPFRRPRELAADSSEALPVVRHAIEQLEAQGWCADAVVYLQPTSPLRGTGPIERAIELLRSGECDTAVSVVRVPHNMTPESLMRDSSGFLEFATPPEARRFRRQDKALLYARNGPAVLASTRASLERGELYGARIKAIEMSTTESHDIDDPLDLEIAERLLPLVRAPGVVKPA
jgi:CMP-N,N'-diacetyllegionaminic acid synthase